MEAHWSGKKKIKKTPKKKKKKASPKNLLASRIKKISSHVPNALAMRARDSMESQCDPATEVQPGGAHTAAPPEAGGQLMADEEDDGEEYEFN